tara:strand:- start:443 stop:658 length:216 start_codon:yes stop_codon:yes gene_type:complete
LEKLSQQITKIIENEFKENSSVKIQDVYKMLGDESPEVEKEKRNHRVRSVIDQMRRTNKIRRVGPSTWEKI